MDSYFLPTLVGIALGFGLASVVYLGVFIRAMKVLHEDNAETAKLLALGDANRAGEVSQTASDLLDADENVTRKVRNAGG